MFVKNVPRHFIFLVFWGTHAPTAAHFTQHMVCTHKKRTPTFHFSCFLGYTYSNHRFFAQHIVCVRQKHTPTFHFSCFFGVHMPKPPFISHNKYIVQFTQNLSKTLFIISFHKNNRPAFETRLYFFCTKKRLRTNYLVRQPQKIFC